MKELQPGVLFPLWTCLAVLVIFSCQLGVISASATSKFDGMRKKIDSFVTKAFGCHKSQALSIAVVKDGQLILTKGYGMTKTTNGSNTTENTRFFIGALTKAFTALLAAKITSDNGSFTLDSPIYKYIPNFRQTDDYRSKHATLRDLLSHRMALSSPSLPFVFGLDPDVTGRHRVTLRMAPNLQATNSFREKFVYNDLMYVVASHVLEKLSGVSSWEQLVIHNIIIPLRMGYTWFLDQLIGDYNNFAYPSDRCEKGKFFDLDPKITLSWKLTGGASTIVSTANSMAKWMNLMLKQTSVSGISNKMIDSVFQSNIMSSPSEGMAKPNDPIVERNYHYALGWNVGLYRDYKVMSHTGTIATHKSYIWLFPDANAGVFAVVNGPQDTNYKDALLKGIMYYASDVLLELTPWFQPDDVCEKTMPWSSVPLAPALPKPVTTITLSDLTIFTGQFTSDVYGKACVKVKSGKLLFEYGLNGVVELSPISQTGFHGKYTGVLSHLNFDLWHQMQLDFSKDASGSVNALTFRRTADASFPTAGPFKKSATTC